MPPGPGTRAPGSFSSTFTPQSTTTNASGSRPPIRRVDSSESDEVALNAAPPPLRPNKQRIQNVQAQHRPSTPSSISSFAIPTHANSSTSSLQNFSRPSAQHSRTEGPFRANSPLNLAGRSSHDITRTHIRKQSQSQGFFEPSLPNASFLPSNLGSGGGSGSSSGTPGSMAPPSNLSASQIAAQAAMHNQSQHMRQRSQTMPYDNSPNNSRRPSRGPVSPPLLSLTEASGERSQNGFGRAGEGQVYRNGLPGGDTLAPATTAANVVFPRSPIGSPSLSSSEFHQAYREPEKPAKAEKPSKVKLFSRPGKVSTKESKEKPLASPNRFGNSMAAALQRSNMSTQSLMEGTASSASSMYSMTNSSSATIRPVEAPIEKEKEKKPHFLSRQKHKLSHKDEHSLPLSSAASNSQPVDPSAPSSLYNFNLLPSPGPSSTSFAKSMSGLDLRHGGRALREKKKEEKAAASEGSGLSKVETAYSGSSEWPGSATLGGGPTFLGPPSAGTPSMYGSDVHADLAKYGLNNMTADDAWPFLKARLLVIFEGEDLRLPVEDFNRLVSLHLQRCIQRRAPNLIVEDLRDLLTTGFSSLDLTLRRTPDERLVPHLVEMWLFTFTSILPYISAVFLPLDLEFAGHGPLMSPENARDFWGALPVRQHPQGANNEIPASQILEVRKIVLTTYRDVVILPRFETLKTIFSRLSLESINTNLNLDALSSSPSESGRPGTAMSLDPSTASYNSQATTLLSQGDSSGARSRAISNVSFGSDQARNGGRFMGAFNSELGSEGRPFTPSSALPSVLSGLNLSSQQTIIARQIQREVNAEESKLVTEMVGRMLQCMLVLSSVGYADEGVGSGAASSGPAGIAADTELSCQAKMDELCKSLKLNWLGRGRTGRNRRGFVGARVKPSRFNTGGVGGATVEVAESSVL